MISSIAFLTDACPRFRRHEISARMLASSDTADSGVFFHLRANTRITDNSGLVERMARSQPIEVPSLVCLISCAASPSIFFLSFIHLTDFVLTPIMSSQISTAMVSTANFIQSFKSPFSSRPSQSRRESSRPSISHSLRNRLRAKVTNKFSSIVKWSRRHDLLDAGDGCNRGPDIRAESPNASILSGNTHSATSTQPDLCAAWITDIQGAPTETRNSKQTLPVPDERSASGCAHVQSQGDQRSRAGSASEEPGSGDRIRTGGTLTGEPPSSRARSSSSSVMPLGEWGQEVMQCFAPREERAPSPLL